MTKQEFAELERTHDEAERHIVAINRLAAAFERVALAQEFNAGIYQKPVAFAAPVVDPSQFPTVVPTPVTT